MKKIISLQNIYQTTTKTNMNYITEQEEFWAGEFGNEYINRNTYDNLLASNLGLFSRTFTHANKPKSIIEFGANVGMNIKALKSLFPEINLFGVEINDKAAEILKRLIGNKNVYNGSIFDFQPKNTFDVSLIKGVLIHINPDMLDLVYKNLYLSSNKYILICEYFNPTPVTVTYRGHGEKLFKRDFAGEMLDMYPDLALIDYGFCYKRDKTFPLDDITWFLLEKNQVTENR